MTAIRLQGAGRSYAVYPRPRDRLLEVITRRQRHREVQALAPIDLSIPGGQVLGIIGNNGAGKSTLLKLIAGTLTPSTGSVHVHGSVGALLELGGGFHPDMTGRENVFLKGAIMGLGREEMRARYDEITMFAGIGPFMDQPVKTYSSGMFMRLAFAVATCVEPDILLIDEALSVGDGAFARKSFDRIMRFKSAGRTILFCSHSLYQVEAVCDRVIWIDSGALRMDGDPAEVIAAYTSFLNSDALPPEVPATGGVPVDAEGEPEPPDGESAPVARGTARLHRVTVSVDGEPGRRLSVRSGHSDVCVEVEFVSDPEIAAPTVGVAITQMDGQMVCSAGTLNDAVALERDPQGRGRIQLCFPRLALLKGTYGVNAYLLCERAIHIYQQATLVAELNILQTSLEQGIVSLPHEWHSPLQWSEAGQA